MEGTAPMGNAQEQEKLKHDAVQLAKLYADIARKSAELVSSALALSLPIGALITNILIIDDIRDRDFDVVKGKNT
ncbi:MAG: hypothetical protein ACXW2I_03865, partial [Burkholderiales bacterium]